MKKLIATFVCAAGFSFAGNVVAQNDTGASTADAPGGVTYPLNFGSVQCTASVNSDGTAVSGRAIESARLTPGNYEVLFRAPCTNIKASKGYMAFVQPHTLSTGVTDPLTCTVADRAGKPNGLYIACFSAVDGSPADTSFQVLVTR